MFKKLLIPALCGVASLAIAEPQRAVLTTENKFPELRQLEVGYDFTSTEYDTSKFRSHEFVARYGLLENLTARLHVPFNTIDPDFGDKEEGIGDVRLGLDLVAYQDVFSFPYAIPHVEVSFPTGDEDKNLGTGDNMVKVGLAIGTVTHEVLHWVADFTYAINTDSKAAVDDDIFSAALSLIWDVSDRFAVSGEGLVQDRENTSSNPVLLGAGLNYKWTPSFQTRFFMGVWNDSADGEDIVLNFNAAYTF
ncbi:MAG TPA: transporter [Kiritimatiellia bacterium]|nr:transporter [Kiritimatiellia bacterium]